MLRYSLLGAATTPYSILVTIPITLSVMHNRLEMVIALVRPMLDHPPRRCTADPFDVAQTEIDCIIDLCNHFSRDVDVGRFHRYIQPPTLSDVLTDLLG